MTAQHDGIPPMPLPDHPPSIAQEANCYPLDAYLASALTGLGPSERDRLFEISDTVAEVCAHHGVRLYEPRKVTDPVHHSTVPDVEVFRMDRHRVIGSDLLIYLAHHPSTGAGQEIVFAQEAIVPIVVVAHLTTRLSRMVTGIPGPLHLVRYDSLAELKEQLDQVIVELKSTLLQRKKVIQDLESHHVGTRIRELRIQRGMTHQQVTESTRIPNAFSTGQLREWEQSSDRLNNLSLTFLREIAFALRVDVKDLV